MITLPEIRIVLRDAGPRRGVERSVGHRQCATVVAGCTAVEARGRAHPKAWNGPSEQIGNTVCIPQKLKRSGALYVSCSRTVTICSAGSDRFERDGLHGPGNISAGLLAHKAIILTAVTRLACRPWCMGFIVCFSLIALPPLGRPGNISAGLLAHKAIILTAVTRLA
jgi:hypothetical protein